MSSVWAKMEALAAEGDPAKFDKCPCGTSDHAGWTFDPAKEEQSQGLTKPHTTQTMFNIAVSMGIEADGGELLFRADQQGVRRCLGYVSALVEMNASYRIPHSAEEERRRFRQDIQELMEPMVKLTKLGPMPPLLWPGDLEAKGGRQMEKMERLVWHHDPRLQLIRFPSFRCFIEVQQLLLFPLLRAAVLTFEEYISSVDSYVSTHDLVARSTACVVFYAAELEKDGAGGELSSPDPAPPPPAESEAAAAEGPSLSKSQRKHAKQKAKKLAARQAKEEAKASEPASSSRSDYIPKMPPPRPATPKKKKAGAAAAAAGPSRAASESGVEGVGGSHEPSETEPGTEETRGESPKPPGDADRKSYALLAHDLARIADLIRRA